METHQPDRDRLEAQMRAADARLDEMEAQARARQAKAEMDEISGLRARRDRVRQKVEQAKKEMKDDREVLRSEVSTEWADVRRGIANAHLKYTAWDDARERRFNAQLDQADAYVREQRAKDAEVGAGVKVQLVDAQRELQDKAAAARRSFDAWKAQKSDEKLQRNLEDAELELDEAFDRYEAAHQSVSQRGSGRTSS
jgi:hypothetical protein